MIISRCLWPVIWVLCCVGSTSSLPAENGTEVWIRLEQRLQYHARERSMLAWNWIRNQSSDLNITDNCRGSLFNLLRSTAELKRWAVQMVDATAKPIGGVLNGKLGLFGNYDECVDIAVPIDYDSMIDIPDDPFKFRGQYCLVDVRPPLPTMGRFLWHWRYLTPLQNLSKRARIKPFNFLLKGMGYIYDLPFRTAICTPSTCNTKDLEMLLVQIVSPYGLKVHVDNCSIRKPIVLSTDLIVIIVVFSFLLSLVIFGTLSDYVFTKPVVRQRVKSYSIKPPPMSHGKQAEELMSDFVMQFMYNAFLSVDSFFFVSSTLFSYFMVKTVNKKGLRAFNIPIIVARRIWRLLPLELLLLGIAELSTLLNKAPLWNEYFENQTKTCKRNWWTILFFVQNLIYPKEACHLHLWYVATDLQFFLITIVYLSIYFRNALAGKIFNLFLIIGGILTTSLVTYSRGFPPSIHMVQTNLRELIEFFEFWYLLPYSHISVCAIGMFVGTFLVKHSNFKISRKAQAFGWTLSMFGFFVPIYVTYFWHADRDLHPAESSIYNGLQRPVWALALSWLTIMCATGRGGFINELLSWKGFIPLNRSSYVLYLIHITVCQFFFRSFTGLNDTTKNGLFWCFFANIMVSYIVSVVLRILFEAPLEELDKMFFSSLLTRARDSSPNRRDEAAARNKVIVEDNPSGTAVGNNEKK